MVTAESIKAPAAVTFVVSVTSAEVSIPVNFVLSAEDIMLPDPADVMSESSVTLCADKVVKSVGLF